MNWTISIGIIIAMISLIWSIANTLIGRYIAAKITGNDLVHLTKDVLDLKKEETNYKKDLKQDLGKIFRRLGKIEREIVKREAICSLRHKNDK